MCGLIGLFEPGRLFDRELIAAMGSDIRHRGPDSEGTLIEAGFALAFQRLAIIDPEARSDQPFDDEESQCSLVFNGEIYNFRRLREELARDGVHFRTEGDTETILRGYIRHGAAFLERLEGMFSLILIDRRRGKALIARDRFGIKPLYVARTGRTLAVASEMRPLFRLVERQVDDTALAELLTFGWAAGELSNYRGVERLAPGTVLTVDLHQETISKTRLPDPLDLIERGHSKVSRECETVPSSESDIEAALHQAVEDHLVSDVGYAMQLSGGVDSSLIAAIAAQKSGRRISTFSVSLGEHDYDEGRFQRAVAEKYNLDHNEVVVSPQAYFETLHDAIRHMEGPTPHGGCTALLLLCRQIRDSNKVVLTGEGADELFGGYKRYADWKRTALHGALSRVFPSWLLPDCWPFRGVRRVSGLNPASYASVYHDFRSVQAAFPGLVPNPGARAAVSSRFNEFLHRMIAVDQSAYLESLLVRQDKMSMAASVEARVPFVHSPLYEVVSRLSDAVRYPGGETKPVLKRIAAKYLPHDLVYRRKIGLWLPYEEWYGPGSPGEQLVEDMISDTSALAHYADKAVLRNLIRTAKQGGRNTSLIVQRLVEIDLWLKSA